MYVFGDSFDLYTTGADLAPGFWDSVVTGPSYMAGRFDGRAANFSVGTSATKSSGANDSVHHFTFAFYDSSLAGSPSGVIGPCVTLYDGATAQCTVGFRNDGSLNLASGGGSGTILDTWTPAYPTAGQWVAYEIEVVVHGTNGGWTIRRSGNTSNDRSTMGLNTRNSANNYANKIALGMVQNISATMAFDDFLWRSDPSSVPWVGDIRCYTRMPMTDSSVQFSRVGSSSTQLWSNTGITNALAANQCEYLQITAPRTGLLTSVSFDCTNGGGGTGHVKLALFSSVGNAVGTVLATSNEITNPGNAIITATFPTPYRMIAGTVYWIGIIQDASITYRIINSSSIGTSGINAITLSTTSYASWPISNPGGTIAAINVPGLFTLYLTPSNNADTVNEPQQDGVTTYVFDSVVGDRDFYGIAARNSPAPPASTVAVITRGFMQRSDAGSRTAAVQLKSGATTVQSTPTQPNSGSFSWLYRADLTDPNTSAAWAPSAVDAVQVGPIVIS